MNSETPPPNDSSPDNEPNEKRSPALALVIAFIPAAMFLGLVTLKFNVSQDALMVPCIISAICCFVSSFMLFNRQTSVAIGVAIIFLLLNVLIAFFFGCAATFKI